MKSLLLLGLWAGWAYFTIYAPYVQDVYEMSIEAWFISVIIFLGISSLTDAHFDIRDHE